MLAAILSFGPRPVRVARSLFGVLAFGAALAAHPAGAAATKTGLAAASVHPGVAQRVVDCITAAASRHDLPAGIILAILRTEGGTLGETSQNSNGTVDIGPMQINSRWLPQLAKRLRVSESAALRRVRDEFCANIDAGAWILRQAIDLAGGDFWKGVGFYHSQTPQLGHAYVKRVVGRMMAQAS